MWGFKKVRVGVKKAHEAERLENMLRYEKALWKQGLQRVAGVDEAGAGPLAGPVVAAAVVLPVGWRLEGVNDSKKVPAKKREALAESIQKQAVAYAYGVCEPEEIDVLNILQASREAMRRAVVGLGIDVEHVLVDARVVPGVRMGQTKIIRGDALSFTIAAASILAKVERDKRMLRYAEQFPEFGFEKHKGYGTRKHMAALQEHGPTVIHRRSFGPVRVLLEGGA
jgi:ribonuclease HII